MRHSNGTSPAIGTSLSPRRPSPHPSETRSTTWTSPPGPRGAPLHPPAPTLRIFTDASTQGWGAMRGSTIQGLGPPEQALHINTPDFIPQGHLARSSTPGQVLPVSRAGGRPMDNPSVVYYINKQGGTSSWSLWRRSTRPVSDHGLPGDFDQGQTFREGST